MAVGIAAVLALTALGRMAWIREPDPPERPPERRELFPRPPIVRGDPGPHPTEDFAGAPELGAGARVVDEAVGDGAPLFAGMVGVVEATAWLPDGGIFESTLEVEQPARWQVGVGALVPGLDAGLVGMRVGGTRLLELEPDAMYGEQGLPGRVPPAAALVWRVELLDAWVPPTASPPWPDHVVDERVGTGPLAGLHPVIDYAIWSTADPDAPIDSSYARLYPLDVVDPRPFAATLEGMRVGGRRLARLPAERAFGAEGRPPLVPPGGELLLRIDVRSAGP